jgi:hypothetical protein
VLLECLQGVSIGGLPVQAKEVHFVVSEPVNIGRSRRVTAPSTLNGSETQSQPKYRVLTDRATVALADSRISRMHL